MSGRNARGLRKLSDGSRLKYRFAKKLFKYHHYNHQTIVEALQNDSAA